jgi:hypothetical protein
VAWACRSVCPWSEDWRGLLGYSRVSRALASSCTSTLGIVMPSTPTSYRAAIRCCSAASPPMSGFMWKDARSNEVKTSRAQSMAITACFQRQIPPRVAIARNVHSLIASPLATLVTSAHVRAIRLYPDMAGGGEALPTPAGHTRSRYPATLAQLESEHFG